MYAVIKTGGKQYRVAKNDVLVIERLAAEVGDVLTFGDVLMLGGEKPTVGTPLVGGASVIGTVIDQCKGDKIIVFKKRRRKNYRRRNGHRQLQTVVRIADIMVA